MANSQEPICPHCGEMRQLEVIVKLGRLVKYLCNTCSKVFWIEVEK